MSFGGSMTEPYKRNFLAEAYRIYKGEPIVAKKQHVIAAMEVLVSFKKQTEKVQEFLNYAIRKSKGLEVPNEPPNLDGFLPEELNG